LLTVAVWFLRAVSKDMTLPDAFASLGKASVAALQGDMAGVRAASIPPPPEPSTKDQYNQQIPLLKQLAQNFLKEHGQPVPGTDDELAAAIKKYPEFGEYAKAHGYSLKLNDQDMKTMGISYSAPSGMPQRGTGDARGRIVELGRYLQAQGFRVSEHPQFGGVSPRPTHVANSQHYKPGGNALDVNWSPAGQEMAKMDALAPQLRAAGWFVLWRVKGHFNHIHVDGR
jgi:hypothetical protein